MAKTPVKKDEEKADQQAPASGTSLVSWRSFFARVPVFLAAVFLLLGISYFLRTKFSLSSARSYRFCLMGSAFTGLGFGFLWWWRPEWKMEFRFLQRVRTRFAILIGITISIVAFTIWCGLSQVGAFDHSALIDTGWRLLNGQTPYKDFPCTLPPGFYLGTLYAFKLFGVYWQSLVIFEALFAAAAFFWIYHLLDQILKNRLFAILVAFLSQAISTMLVAYWWYNPVTATSAVIFMLSCVVWLMHPKAVRWQASYFCSLLLLSFMKPNLAGPLIGGCISVLISSVPHRWRSCSAAASSPSTRASTRRRGRWA